MVSVRSHAEQGLSQLERAGRDIFFPISGIEAQVTARWSSTTPPPQSVSMSHPEGEIFNTYPAFFFFFFVATRVQFISCMFWRLFKFCVPTSLALLRSFLASFRRFPAELETRNAEWLQKSFLDLIGVGILCKTAACPGRF